MSVKKYSCYVKHHSVFLSIRMKFLEAICKLIPFCGRTKKMSSKNVIFITGCDSGLGYTFAQYCHSLNMTVIAGCHSSNSIGANKLRQKNIDVIEVDLCKQETITNVSKKLEDLLNQQTSNEEPLELTALVNNAGVMLFGEFEWQTPEQCEHQIQVNVLGTWNMTRALLPLVRQHQARIINVTSHCGLNALPGVSCYSASKAALKFWNDALRIEMAQYKVKVINFIPGSFVMCSNISAKQQQHAQDQRSHLNAEQHKFYGEYFERYHNYLKIISGVKEVAPLNDSQLLAKFENALTHTHPKDCYIHEPWRYIIYRILFSIMPTPLADWLKVKFCAMPTYDEITYKKDK